MEDRIGTICKVCISAIDVGLGSPGLEIIRQGAFSCLFWRMAGYLKNVCLECLLTAGKVG